MKLKENLWDFFMITCGITIVAIAVFFFMMPSNVTVGSVTALAIVMSHFIPLSVSVIALLLNIILLAVGFFLIGKDFGVKTVYTALLTPVLIGVFEMIFPNNQSITGDQLIDVVAYCVLVAIGQAMLFVRNASSGGLDIVAKIMNKYLHMELGKAVGVAGMAVAFSSVLISDKKGLVLSILATYFNSLVIDHFIFGNTVKKRVCILSQHEQEILDFILYELHSGATKYHAYGTFSDAQHTEINTIVDKNEYLKLMNFITKTDPDAFVTVYTVNEMMYKPKTIVKEK